jgi:tagatose-1,6-bisphosphate aldolase
MSEFQKMADSGVPKKRETLIQLLARAKSEKSQITADQILDAYEYWDDVPRRQTSFFSNTRKTVTVAMNANRDEERLAKALYLLRELDFDDGTKLRLLDYQVPLKQVRKDKGVGKIDLVGIINNQSLALVELKTERSTENPRRALLEILCYGAIVKDPKNFAKMADEIKKACNVKLSEGVNHVILAPPAYWQRWRGKRRQNRWNEFCTLCRSIRGAANKIKIQCLALEMGTKRVNEDSLE